MLVIPHPDIYAGDKLTSSGLVKAMCVEALCQAVPCGIRDCKESLISLTWSDVRVALPDLDQAWQQALHGLKQLSTHTSVPFLKCKVVTEAVPANREKSNDHHVIDLFCHFDTIDAATPTAPQPSTDVQFQPLREDIQGFYTIMPAGKHVP